MAHKGLSVIKLLQVSASKAVHAKEKGEMVQRAAEIERLASTAAQKSKAKVHVNQIPPCPHIAAVMSAAARELWRFIHHLIPISCCGKADHLNVLFLRIYVGEGELFKFEVQRPGFCPATYCLQVISSVRKGDRNADRGPGGAFKEGAVAESTGRRSCHE
jgi:hypothetical protein